MTLILDNHFLNYLRNYDFYSETIIPFDDIFLAILVPILPIPIIPKSLIYNADLILSTILSGLSMISINVQ